MLETYFFAENQLASIEETGLNDSVIINLLENDSFKHCNSLEVVATMFPALNTHFIKNIFEIICQYAKCDGSD